MPFLKVNFTALKKQGYIETPDIGGPNCIIKIQKESWYAKVSGELEPEDIGRYPKFDFVRFASEADEIHYDLQARRCFFFTSKANDFCKSHNIGCKIVSTEPTFDISKVLFYFTATGFLNLRPLIKYMNSVTKANIEFNQVEGRERARIVSDVGACGLQTCCTRFLFESPIISREDVKGMWSNEQDSLGVCGRIKCCATFEKRSSGKEGCDEGTGCGNGETCGSSKGCGTCGSGDSTRESTASPP